MNFDKSNLKTSNSAVIYVNSSPPKSSPKPKANRHSKGRISGGAPSKLISGEIDTGSEAVSEDTLQFAVLFKRNIDPLCRYIYYDTHCHIDLLFERLKFKGNWSQFKERYANIIPDKYSGCIQVFCDPRNFFMNDYYVSMLRKAEDVWFTFGVHPKKVSRWDKTTEIKLRHMLTSLKDKVVALGEIGLDYSSSHHLNYEKQMLALRDQVKIAVSMNLPLVIHCREADSESTSCIRDAHEDLMNILMELCIPTQKLHIHCFTGTWQWAERWLKTFPNSYIGVTPLVTWSGKKSANIRDVAEKIPFNRLLLETDSPYFIPKFIPPSELSLCQPWFALSVAKEFAFIREVPMSTVLTSCLENCNALYGLPL